VIQILRRFLPTKRPDISQDDYDQAKTFLLLKFGTMNQAASTWSHSQHKEDYTVAQAAVIKVWIKDRMGLTHSTGPK